MVASYRLGEAWAAQTSFEFGGRWVACRALAYALVEPFVASFAPVEPFASPSASDIEKVGRMGKAVEERV